jgi:hypothetical protein
MSAYDWHPFNRPRPFRSQSFLATDHDTRFEFADDGTLTISEKDFDKEAEERGEFEFKFVPVARYVPERKPCRYIYKAEPLFPGDVPAFLMDEGRDGWQLAAAYPVGTEKIQVLLMKEIP